MFTIPHLTLIVVLGQLLITIVECKHDYHVIEGSNRNETYHNTLYHKYDSVLWFCVHLLLSLTVGNWMIILSGLSLRLVILQVYLNHLLGNPITYLSKRVGSIDHFCYTYIGPDLTLVIKIVLTTITCILTCL